MSEGGSDLLTFTVYGQSESGNRGGGAAQIRKPRPFDFGSHQSLAFDSSVSLQQKNNECIVIIVSSVIVVKVAASKFGSGYFYIFLPNIPIFYF